MEGPTTTVPVLNGDHHNFRREPLAIHDPHDISASHTARTPKEADGVQVQDSNNGSSIVVEKVIPKGARVTDGAERLNGVEKDRNDVITEYVESHGAMALSDGMPETQQLGALGTSRTPIATRNGLRTTEIHTSQIVNEATTRSTDEGYKLSDEKLQRPVGSLGSLPPGAVGLQDKSPVSNEESSPQTAMPTGPGGLPASSNGDIFTSTPNIESLSLGASADPDVRRPRNLTIETGHKVVPSVLSHSARPGLSQRALSTPGSVRSPLSPQKGDRSGSRPTLRIPETAAKSEGTGGRRHSSSGRPLPSPMPTSIPLPPLSIPTYLQLELSSQRPSQLYIHRSANSDFPYESSRVKTERLLNFLVLPFYLERVLWFGTLACVDSWLYTFTILPLRLLKSIYILAKSWCTNFTGEVHFVSRFVYSGAGRMWRRRRSSVVPTTTRKPSAPDAAEHKLNQPVASHSRRPGRQHQRMKSIPSALLPDDKADMLKGLLIICTSLVLLRLDASRMYHWIRGQAAIKLYVIYNLLEVCDRLFSAIGQDVLECLFSKEALERKPDGHSKVLRPFWLFVLALIYTVIHSTALFYQVITLNVAVNSYSNALITLLMSNQFVEIKSTVFKKFEKENLFQLTCADVVERFQLWHMLVIIASRNIVETGGLSAGLTAFTKTTTSSPSAPLITNSSIPITTALPPRSVSSILPKSFTLVPAVVQTITTYAPAVSQVLGPFLAVLGSEMLVDWLKHAYINKFNNTRPAIYERFLDVLAKDYYTNAFGDQNLTKRLGLPVIPLSCLLIRASVQTYKMFMAAWIPSSPTSSTSLASIHEHYSSSARGATPMTTSTAISHTLDEIIAFIPTSLKTSSAVTHITTVLLFLLFFLVLLALKLVLGMLLLSFARSRYRSMKLRERNPIYHVDGGRRVGGWGVVEVDDDKRRWIYDDDPAGHKNLKEREEKDKKSKERGNGVESFEKVKRYEMVAKRIW
ncbi:putative cytomegalovirus gH-receptor family protein [Cladophialophora carrionii]|uniref:Putative cytomegalovirus gH-receptor family protein n=1 Tax=Cladophialophora carrionii TaxID=86049 RepID=A0A1C1CYR3_9EURO|nr:putative cytomegalovirus gH-receptor family protein [Cladophialophora carrionii]